MQTMQIAPLSAKTSYSWTDDERDERRSILSDSTNLLLPQPTADTITNNHVIDSCLFGRYQWYLAIACSLARMAAFSHIFLGMSLKFAAAD